MFKSLLRPVYVPVIKWFYKTFRAPKRYQYLYETIRTTQPKVIVEVGTWNGNRAEKMITEAKRFHPANEITYVGFDLFEDLTDDLYEHELSKRPPHMAEVQEKLKATGANITLVKGNTLTTLPEFSVSAPQQADFVFIDGGHDVATIQSDWDEIAKMMHEKTVVIFDDYWRNRPLESAGPVVSGIDKNKYEVEVLPKVDSFNNPDFGQLDISFVKVARRL